MFFQNQYNCGMFNPDEIIFAATSLCNLHCPHCFVDRKPCSLKTVDAITFLKSERESQVSSIEKIGFSGGEPFLSMDFLCGVIKYAVGESFLFDRIMTNGDWWKSNEELRMDLQKIYEAGYDGKIGLSYDAFHGQDEERVATFIRTVWEIFGDGSIEIQSVAGAGDVYEKLKSLASALNLGYEENISKSGRGIALLSDGEHHLGASIQTESYQSTDSRAFKSKKWFREDFCEGPGQVLFVHPTGDIAPCCGFANENPELFVGKITDSFDAVMESATKNRMVKICYGEGLSRQIKILKKQKKIPAGKTDDACTFCDWVCRNCF